MRKASCVQWRFPCSNLSSPHKAVPCRAIYSVMSRFHSYSVSPSLFQLGSGPLTKQKLHVAYCFYLLGAPSYHMYVGIKPAWFDILFNSHTSFHTVMVLYFSSWRKRQLQKQYVASFSGENNRLQILLKQSYRSSNTEWNSGRCYCLMCPSRCRWAWAESAC